MNLVRFLTLIAVLHKAAEARIIKLTIERRESPTFAGASFGDTGQYEKIVGRVTGEVNVFHPLNAVITDLQLVPRAPGSVYVQYETTFYMLKPVDPAKGNGLLFYSVPNRGDKRSFAAMNQGISNNNDPTAAGDGLPLRRGWTYLWSGWQADVQPGNNRQTITLPVAKNPDGSPITGPVRMELIPSSAQSTWNFVFAPPVPEQAANATLTVRKNEADPRVLVPKSDWAYGDCASTPFPGRTSDVNICLRGGFQPDSIYEFIYTGKDPVVQGLGLAATRDIVSFFRYAPKDDAGTPNPLAGAITAAMAEGQSQSGRFLRTFLDLGFNQDEFRNIVFDGMNPHIASQGIPVNVRFGQPDRSMGQRENALYPAPEGPLTWGPTLDPLAGRYAGILDRCRETLSCPKIAQTIGGTEFWQGRMSLNLTDAAGTTDVEIPDNVRIYYMASTQHTPTTSNSTGSCQTLQNPAPHFDTRRAILIALEQWVLEGKLPPPSRYPRVSDGTLVPFDAKSIGWPGIPGVKFPTGIGNLAIRDFGVEFDSRRVSGITSQEPPRVGPAYTMLAPKLDSDGNEIGGIRSTTIRVPMGTYAGWALRRAGFGEDELCGLTGSFIPFKATRAERLAANDPRPSLEERYKDPAAITAAVTAAARELVSQGYLLQVDADRLIATATSGQASGASATRPVRH